MQSRSVSFAFLGISAAALAAGSAGLLHFDDAGGGGGDQASLVPIAGALQGYGGSGAIGSDIARWNSLRQSDALPFSSYSSFLTSHRGWPGEASLRRTAERKIDPNSVSPGEVLRYFSVHPPLTAGGHAHQQWAARRGEVDAARIAARAGCIGRDGADEESRLLGASRR